MARDLKTTFALGFIILAAIAHVGLWPIYAFLEANHPGLPIHIRLPLDYPVWVIAIYLGVHYVILNVVRPIRSLEEDLDGLLSDRPKVRKIDRGATEVVMLRDALERLANSIKVIKTLGMEFRSPEPVSTDDGGFLGRHSIAYMTCVIFILFSVIFQIGSVSLTEFTDIDGLGYVVITELIAIVCVFSGVIAVQRILAAPMTLIVKALDNASQDSKLTVIDAVGPLEIRSITHKANALIAGVLGSLSDEEEASGDLTTDGKDTSDVPSSTEDENDTD